MLRHIESLQNSKRTSSSSTEVPKEQPQPVARVAASQQPSSPSPKSPIIKPPVIPVGVDRKEPIKGFKKAMAKAMTASLVKFDKKTSVELFCFNSFIIVANPTFWLL